ncbi:hypothetical protein TSAR_004624 [Trichomalopsis sarcophagae]|uniref:Uncharacterized protein n=1 Tax=Trichomalopsis sarcophagae TaxID=543379 RepID=A0A232EFU1_9HYME|nr:hypothetical protein TSAR_004624 [Trichomalopsis sarcophagae]
MFTRSIRIGDFQLFKFMLPELCNIYFIFNQVNYSHWLRKYHDHLLKVDETYSKLTAELKKGFFGIKRTDKLFSRIPCKFNISLNENTNVEKVLTFPLISLPMSLCYLDGTICKTEKSAFMKCFKAENTSPSYVVLRIIDVFFIALHARYASNIQKYIKENITNDNT